MNSNQLKLIAAAAMAVDHIGYFIFPQAQILRIIGRLSYPIFSYFIIKGCSYTHNKTAYFLKVSLLGLACMITTFLFDGIIYGNILITFSLSIVMLCEVKWIDNHKTQGKITVSQFYRLMIFALTIIFIFLLCRRIEVDYGFYGVLAPVFAEMFSIIFRNIVKNNENKMQLISLTGFAAGLVCTALHSNMGAIQFYSLTALPLLMLYNGKKGKRKMGIFFYLFYPTHIVLIQLTATVLYSQNILPR